MAKFIAQIWAAINLDQDHDISSGEAWEVTKKWQIVRLDVDSMSDSSYIIYCFQNFVK